MPAQDKGRKRHIATDTLGPPLVVLVTAASVQDTTGGRDVIDALPARHPGVVKAWADSGYQRSVIELGAAGGIDVQIVRKDPGQKGFAPLPRRWAVERTFGWWMLHRRLARDFETLPERPVRVHRDGRGRRGRDRRLEDHRVAGCAWCTCRARWRRRGSTPRAWNGSTSWLGWRCGWGGTGTGCGSPMPTWACLGRGDRPGRVPGPGRRGGARPNRADLGPRRAVIAATRASITAAPVPSASARRRARSPVSVIPASSPISFAAAVNSTAEAARAIIFRSPGDMACPATPSCWCRRTGASAEPVTGKRAAMAVRHSAGDTR